jgi:hypothetical protein
MAKPSLPSDKPNREIIQRKDPIPRELQLGGWTVVFTRKLRVVLSLAGLVVLCGPAAFFISEFDQTRGVVSLAASRVWLFGLCVVIFLAFWLVSGQLVKRQLWAVLLSLVVGVAVFTGIDRWAPKPMAQGVSIRPQFSIAALGLQHIVLSSGDVAIKFDIKNNIIGPVAQIDEANVTLWYETSKDPLPEYPRYESTIHKLTGIVIAPGDTFNATFTANRMLSEDDVKTIERGTVRLFVFGYVKYRARDGGQEQSKGFIALYKPKNDPTSGMFDYFEQPNYAYDK